MIMWEIIGSIIGGPVVKGLVESYKAKLDAGNTTERIAADLAAKELAVDEKMRELATQIELQASGPWWKSGPRALAEWSFGIFIAKCVVWDKVFAMGSTDALGGDLQQAFIWLTALWFGGRTIEKVAQIFSIRK